MPTIGIPGALLALSATLDDDTSDDDGMSDSSISRLRPPWCWPTWQERTTIYSNPFTPTHGPNSLWETPESTHAVWTFASNFWTMTECQQIAHIKRKLTDNDRAGRILWLDWVKVGLPTWKIQDTIERVLSERGFDPYTVMKRLKTNTVPDLAVAQVPTCYPDLARDLFGEDGFTSDGICMKEPVRRFVELVMINKWIPMKSGVVRERARLEGHRKDVNDLWEALTTTTESRTRPLREDVRRWTNGVNKLTKILQRYGDKDSLQQLSEQRERLGDMLSAMGLDDKGRDKMRLPKALREALQYLASREQIDLLKESIHEQLRLADPASTENTMGPDFDVDNADALDIEWSEGVEDLSSLSEDELWQYLGIPDKKIPFFNAYVDPQGVHDPWSEEGRQWLKSRRHREPLLLRPYQVVGVVKNVSNAFAGKAILLMDAVGLGKTIQVIATIAILTYYREYYDAHGKFPGAFAGKVWREGKPNIPNLPIVIVVPVSLVDQWVSELHKFLQHGSFDIFPYLNSYRSRQNWWDNIWKRSQQPEWKKVLVSSLSAILSDYDYVFEAGCNPPSPKKTFDAIAPDTVYGRRWLLTAGDESHELRNRGKKFWSCYSLHERSDFVVSMTATPCITSPQDLWNLGQCLLIAEFGNDYATEAEEMKRELRSAAAKDRREMKKGKLKGEAATMVWANYFEKVLKWIRIIREKFTGTVIRQTLQSKDNRGEPISGLEPYIEKQIVIKLYPHEMANLDELAKDMVKDGTHRAAHMATGSDFYVHLRLALVHPSCNPNSLWTDPETIEDWNKVASRKLDTMAEILLWHLEQDGRPPLQVIDDKLVPCVGYATATPTDDRDKIVVCSEFPKGFPQITKVLELNGIKHLVLHGGVNPANRTNILREFKQGGANDARVLLISCIGLTGLNLQCANISISLGRFWSNAFKDQYIGRIWRSGQKKKVKVYDIIARDTQDVFLSQMSSSKAAIHDAFVGATPHMRELFERKENDLEEILSDELQSEGQNIVKSNGRKPKTSGKQAGNKLDTSMETGKSGKENHNDSRAQRKKGAKAGAREKQTPTSQFADRKKESSDNLTSTPASRQSLPNEPPEASASNRKRTAKDPPPGEEGTSRKKVKHKKRAAQDPPPNEPEAKVPRIGAANDITDVIARVRGNGISTEQLIAAAALLNAGQLSMPQPLSK